MEINLRDKVAIVTGAANGIGKTISQQLKKEGLKLALWDNDLVGVEALCNELNLKGSDVMFSNCDVSKESDVEMALSEAVSAFGKVDILVANAGIAHFSPVIEMANSDWDEVFAVNTRGVFNCVKKVGAEMKKNKWGRIIVASSFAAILPSANSAAYAASKAGVVSLTRVLASELGKFNITVNSYAPGMIPTAMSGIDKLSEERKKELLETLAIPEWGRAEDIASLIIFLASDQARYITGTHIDASGGKFSVQFAKYA